MASFNFPNSPVVGTKVTTPQGVTYQYDGDKWLVVATTDLTELDTRYVLKAGDIMTGLLRIFMQNPRFQLRAADGDVDAQTFQLAVTQADQSFILSLVNSAGAIVRTPLTITQDADGIDGMKFALELLAGGEFVYGTMKRYTPGDPADEDKQLLNKELADAMFLSLAGGTLTNFLTLHAAPTADLHAATKKYVDDALAASESAAGGPLPAGYEDNAVTYTSYRAYANMPVNLVLRSYNYYPVFTDTEINGNVAGVGAIGSVSSARVDGTDITAGGSFTIPADTWYLRGEQRINYSSSMGSPPAATE